MSANILIVDDSATTRALIKRSLTIAGVEVGQFFEAPNGRVALEMIATHAIDLALVDLHMPEMSGVELAHQLLQDPVKSTIPIAIVSAEPSAARILELKRAGVRGYLRKPFTPESIRDLVLPLLKVPHVC